MAENHVKTAHAWGVQQALQQLGYSSLEELRKEAHDLGLLEQKTASAPGNVDLDALFRSLKR